jgi:hypothetical protein
MLMNSLKLMAKRFSYFAICALPLIYVFSVARPNEREENNMPEQVFSIHPDNPRCFIYKGKPFKILTSAEHYGAVLNADFDYDIYIKEMKRTGQNGTRVFTFYREKDSSISGPGNMNTLAPRPEASVMPWVRVPERGKAADGLNKFHLNRWNTAYFDRLRDYVRKCDENGIVCEIVLFCNPYSQDKYDMFPCSAASNVNGIGGDIDNIREFMTLKAPTIVAFQEQFVRKIVAELNELDNVYYEICNEPNLYGDFSEEGEKSILEWHSHLARIIREAESKLAKRHLIAANAHFVVKVKNDPDKPIIRHEDLGYAENPDIDIINYHYISAKNAQDGLTFIRESAQTGLTWHFMRRRDQFRKPIVFDETYSGIVRGAPERYAINRAEAWEMILSGGAGYSNLDWTFTPADERGFGEEPIGDGRKLDGRCLREWFGIFRGLLIQYDLSTLVPAVGLLNENISGYGYAASKDDNGRYILYFVDENVYESKPCKSSILKVSLKLPSGSYSVQMFHPKNGDTVDISQIQSDGIVELVIPEFAEDIAILINLK